MMTDIEQKALALLNGVRAERDLDADFSIHREWGEQHKAFKQDAMKQAHMTASLYAHEAAVAFEKIFGKLPADEPHAATIFIGQYIRTAAHDFDVAMRERSK